GGGMSDLELRDRVRRAMTNGTNALVRLQNNDGSWTGEGSYTNHVVGMTSLAIMALINCDTPVNSPEVQNGLNYLRTDGGLKNLETYEGSLMLMALCAAEEYHRDMPLIRALARQIEDSQERNGAGQGLWGYGLIGSLRLHQHPDRSNGQFAILALRDAAYAGVDIDPATWKRAHQHFVSSVRPGGGWSYELGGGSPSGSMTAAGISSLAITSRMLLDDSDVDASGRPDCCARIPPNDAMLAGIQWLGSPGVFSVYSNPGQAGSAWHYYYLYGLERAGRLSNMRFFGEYDWYREGARFFIDAQDGGGTWRDRHGGGNPVMDTSMALLFLSKGLSRVVVNKLDYESPPGQLRLDGDWNRHPWDIVSLIDLVDSLPNWPPRLTSQVVTLSRLNDENAVSSLNQAPVLFISGQEAPRLTDRQVEWLRGYVDEGGFLFAAANCSGKEFDTGFRDIVSRMFPEGEASLQRLTADHPIFRAEYLLNADGIELHGVDFGCRTAIVYSPDDIGCLWQKWKRFDPPARKDSLKQRIRRSTMIGINVLAYATGREPPEKLSDVSDNRDELPDAVGRGLLEVAQLRHDGGWDTAPRALSNLLKALNQAVGVSASTQNQVIPVTLEELTRFPLVYMHGRYDFRFDKQRQEALREYLDRGGVLFADACCGSTKFDAGFRQLMKEMFPMTPLKQIPVDHELFSESIGENIREVTRRRQVPGQDASMRVREELGPPILEGIEIDGRIAVIYSRYDISCALEHQASLSCDGYIEEDAAKIAINVVLYAMLQEIAAKGQESPYWKALHMDEDQF
ncbi:MAG: DUF4159 domain-containing protein, partial [Planctomycetaceae bacterium]|nr:DUF4159 domain-containing protein [Planctomycetaceae bacterium]